MTKTVPILIVVVIMLLMPVTTTLAQGQDKIDICHLDEYGNFIPISVAAPALKAHLAHGDKIIGQDVDENCQPLWSPQAGCMIMGYGTLAPYRYFPTNGSWVQEVSGQYFYSNDTCTSYDLAWFSYWQYLVWAEDLADAQAKCNELFPSNKVYDTFTPHLFRCWGS